MTDDAKNLLRECLQYLYESAPAEVYDRITAHLAAPAEKVEPVEWLECQDFYEVCQSYRHAKDGVSSNGMPTAAEAFTNLKHYIASNAPADQWRRVEDGLHPMATAPLDGTDINLLIRHFEYWTALKIYGKENADKNYQGFCKGKWIDFNGGGWTWGTLAGTPVGWMPLPAMPEGE